MWIEQACNHNKLSAIFSCSPNHFYMRDRFWPESKSCLPDPVWLCIRACISGGTVFGKGGQSGETNFGCQNWSGDHLFAKIGLGDHFWGDQFWCDRQQTLLSAAKNCERVKRVSDARLIFTVELLRTVFDKVLPPPYPPYIPIRPPP